MGGGAENDDGIERRAVGGVAASPAEGVPGCVGGVSCERRRVG